jgi:hypothetical protein
LILNFFSTDTKLHKSNSDESIFYLVQWFGQSRRGLWQQVLQEGGQADVRMQVSVVVGVTLLLATNSREESNRECAMTLFFLPRGT